MASILGPKCFLSSALFLLTILSIYGVVGVVLNYLQVSRNPQFGEWPFNLRPAFQAYMIILCLLPLSGLFVLLAVWKRQPMLLYCSGFVLLGIFTCCAVMGSVCIRASSQGILDEFYATFKKNRNDGGMMDWINDKQWQYQCCGIYSYSDWYLVKGADADNATKLNAVPPSCCRRDTILPNEDCRTRDMADKRDPIDINTIGCGSTISNEIRDTCFRLGVEMWVAGIVSFCMAMFLYVGVTNLYVLTGKPLVFGTSRSLSNDANNGFKMPTAEDGNGFNLGVRSDRSDVNNNNHICDRSSMSFGERAKRRSSTLQKKSNKGKEKAGKDSKKRSSKNPFKKIPFSPVLSRSKVSKNYSGTTRGAACLSKSFILGDVQSHLVTAAGEANCDPNDCDLLRKNVDMLWYQSNLEKNMSTMSTTPNGTSSMMVSGMLQNRKPFGADLAAVMNDAFSQRNTLYTLVSERPFTPSLSQNCSVPFFNEMNQLQNGDTPNLGQCSPHFSTSKQRHIHTYPVPVEMEEESEEDTSSAMPQFILDSVDQTVNPMICIINDEDSVISDKEKTANAQANAGMVPAPPPPTTTSSKYPTSTVRSSTLATIHEESESVKGSPVNTKGASPASGYMTPENVSPQQTKMCLNGCEEGVTECHNEDNSTPRNDNNNGLFEPGSARGVSEALMTLVELKPNINDTAGPLSGRVISVGQQEAIIEQTEIEYTEDTDNTDICQVRSELNITDEDSSNAVEERNSTVI